MRIAEKEDVDLLFQWANEPEVRKNSFSMSRIPYEEHVQWYQRLLERRDCRQYIYMEGGTPVGQARITAEGDVAEIGYSIAAEWRSQGYGSDLLRLLTEQAWKDFPHVTKVIGKIKPENLASQRAFSNAGYQETYRVYELGKSDVR